MNIKNLNHLTFLMLLPVYTKKKFQAVELVLSYFQKHFKTNIVLFETGLNLMYRTRYLGYGNINHIYIEDIDFRGNRAYHINQVLKTIKTPVCALWTATQVVLPRKIVEAVKLIVEESQQFVLPYDKTEEISPSNFEGNISDKEIRMLMQESSGDPIFLSNRMNRDAIIFNTESFKKIGFENEYVLSPALNTFERIKRLEILGYEINRIPGTLFQLSEMVTYNSHAKDTKDLSEVMKVCGMDTATLTNYVNQWPWTKSTYQHVIQHQTAKMKDQKKSIRKLYRLIKPKYPFPLSSAWPVGPDLLMCIARIIQSDRPNTIVECGSGLSSIVCGYLLKMNSNGHLYSLEHDLFFFRLTQYYISLHNLSEYVTLIYAPLTEIYLKGKKWKWYNFGPIKSFKSIDMLIVDGPPGSVQKNARYPAIPMLTHNLSKKVKIIVDDCDRHEDLENVRLWEQEFRGLKSTPLESAKNACIMTY